MISYSPCLEKKKVAFLSVTNTHGLSPASGSGIREEHLSEDVFRKRKGALTCEELEALCIEGGDLVQGHNYKGFVYSWAN